MAETAADMYSLGGMLRALTEPLDRIAIRSATRSVRCGTGPATHLKEAEEVLARADFFGPAEVAPARPEFSSRTSFHFPSAISTPWDENNVVWGKFFRTGRNWQKDPAVLLVHGWNGELGYYWQFPLLAELLRLRGINCAMIELPYHGRRRPRQAGAINNFISHDLLSMLNATRQAVIDCRAVLAWLHEQGSRPVVVWGISLGAWLAGLIAVHERLLRFTVLMSPVVRLDHAIRDLPFCEPIRQSLAGRPFDVARLNLLSHRPFCGSEGVLLIESIHDLFASVESVEELWRAWGTPEIWRLPHGHISILMSPSAMLRTIGWIKRTIRAAALSEKPEIEAASKHGGLGTARPTFPGK